MHFRSRSHFGHDNEARNGQAGLYKANNKGKIALTGAEKSSGVIIEAISSPDCLILSQTPVIPSPHTQRRTFTEKRISKFLAYLFYYFLMRRDLPYGL